MKRALTGFFLICSLIPAAAEQTTDDFESGNPNDWMWVGGASNPVIKTSGGNRDSWFDSGTNYSSEQPGVGTFPPSGSTLLAALTSGSIVAVSFDFKRLDPGSCSPQSNDPANFALTFIDTHSSGDGGFIQATYVGDESPGDAADWTAHTFFIDSRSTSVPDGWLLSGAPDRYTWADLMRNIDGIKISAVDPNSLNHRLCYRLGFDNIVVNYGNAIFSNGFDATP